MSGPRTTDHLGDCVLQHARQDFVRVLVHQTVGEALAYVQQSRVEGRIVYFYVTDDAGRLVGVVPTRRLLLNPQETKIADIMVRQVIALPARATLLDACEFFMLHRLLALPIVDDEGRIVGVIDVELYTDEISDLADREQSDAIFQLIGDPPGPGEPGLAGWGRFVGGFRGSCGTLPAGWRVRRWPRASRAVLHDAVVLALFIPVVLALGESVAIQTLTLGLQTHHGLRLDRRTLWRALRRESTLGLLLGLAAGGVVAMAALAWHGRGVIALAILRRDPGLGDHGRFARPAGARAASLGPPRPAGRLRADRPGDDRRGDAVLLPWAGEVALDMREK